MSQSFHKLRIAQLTNRSALASLDLAERTFGKDSPQFHAVRDFMKEKRAGYVATVRNCVVGFIVHDNWGMDAAQVLALAIHKQDGTLKPYFFYGRKDFGPLPLNGITTFSSVARLASLRKSNRPSNRGSATMKMPINLETWNRTDHYNLFRKYDVPFWSVSANIDGIAIARAKETPDFVFQAAVKWLMEYLKDGPKPVGNKNNPESGTVFGDADVAGFKCSTIWRSSKILGTQKKKIDRRWYWSLPTENDLAKV